MVCPSALGVTRRASPPSAYGQTPVWGSCTSLSSATPPTSRPRSAARCRFPSTTPTRGAQAQLAVIRVPATGDRIGVLMVNPGGPGASAVDTVAGMGAHWPTPTSAGASTWSASTRAASATPRRSALPHRRRIRRLPPRADGRLQPGGRRAHRAAVPEHRPVLHRQDRAWTSWPTSGPRPTARDMDVVRAALGENQINYLGFSYGTELGATYAEQYPDRVRAMVLDGAVDPGSDPIGENIRQLAGFQMAFDDYAADCARSADCPLGTDPTQFVDRYHQLVNPLVQQPGRTSDPRGLSYQDAITGTVNALYTQRYWKYLTSGLLGSAARHRRGRPAAAGRRLPASRPGRPLRQPAGRVHRDPLRRRAVPDRPGGVGRRRPSAPARPRRSWPTASSPASPPATSARCGRCRRRRRRTTCRRPVPARSSWCRRRTIRRRRTRPASTWPARWMPSLITFDGTQHTVVFNGDACVDPAVVAFLSTRCSRRTACAAS